MGKIVVYIGERRTGKTTELIRNIDQSSIILDSAVEHPQCSLICKIKKFYPNLWLFRLNLLSFFKNPRKFLNNLPLSFDVSFFLERAHDFSFLSPVLLFLYYIQVHLILSVIYKRLLYSSCHFKIILDEIKMLSATQKLLLILASKKQDINVFIAVHYKKSVLDLLKSKNTKVVYLRQKFE